MNIFCIITIVYFLIGVILTYVWWNDEYEPEYELEKENDGVEEPLAIIFLACLVFFWPFKVIKNYFEGLASKMRVKRKNEIQAELMQDKFNS